MKLFDMFFLVSDLFCTVLPRGEVAEPELEREQRRSDTSTRAVVGRGTHPANRSLVQQRFALLWGRGACGLYNCKMKKKSVVT